MTSKTSAIMLTTAQWATILIPVACAVSRFAADILLSVTAVLFLINAAMQRDTDWLKPTWVKVALGLWVYVVALSFIAPDFASSITRSAVWVRYPVFAAACAFWVLRDARTQSRLMGGLAIAVAFMILDTALQYFTGTDILGYDSIPAEGSPRLTGPFSAPRVGIMLVWMAVPVVAYYLMGADGKTRRGKPLALGAFYAIGFLSVVFMSGERMALLLTGLGFVLAFFMLPISKRLMLLIGLGAALCMGLLAYTNPGLVERHLGSTTKVVDDIGASDYGKIWISAWEVTKAHPVFGVGLKQFREVCPDPQYGNDDPFRCNQHPHNTYLEWLSESGIIGLVVFTALVVLIVREMLRALPYLRYNPVFLGLAITMCIRLWPLASTTSFFTAWSAVPMWLVLGWMLTLTHAQNDARKEPSA